MHVYLAALNNQWIDNSLPTDAGIDKKDINSLITFVQLRSDKKLAEEIKYFKRFMLDSGAFTFVSDAKKAVDWNDYLNDYADFINKYDIDLFFELDIDKLVGLEEVERMRARLERLTGKKPIPVWHHWRGKQYLVDMCRNYPYVAYGAFITDGLTKQYSHGMVPWAIQVAHEHGSKIHGLGFTSFDKLREFHFDSVDSSSWLAGQQYGYIAQFVPQIGKIKHINRPAGKKLQTYKVSRHNFGEWAKFAMWAENNL